MNIIGYADTFGEYDFKEKPFNNVDATICITLAYLNFDEFFAKNKSESVLIKNIPDNSISSLCAGEFTTYHNKKIIKKLRQYKRYKDIEVKYVRSIHDTTHTTQFFAMTLLIPNSEPLICFRGTDLTIVGWKENLLLAINNALPSHIEACNYIKSVSQNFNGRFRIGGHSKGGNIAIYAAINVDKKIQDRIRCIYNLDGPGFRNDEIFKSTPYSRVKDKLIQIFPHDDVVGALFTNSDNYFVIKSRGISVIQHNPYYWIVEKYGDFRYIANLSKRVNIRNLTLKIWADGLSYDDSILAIDTIVEIFGGVNSNLIDFAKFFLARMWRYLKIWLKYPKEMRKKLRKILKDFIESYKKARKYYKKKNRNNVV